MRRTFSISILLIANIILLAHVAIPHHHHDKVMVALVHPWENEPCHHAHDCEGYPNNGLEDCILTEVLKETIVPDASAEFKNLLLTSHLLQHLPPLWDANIIDVTPDFDVLQYFRHSFRLRHYSTNFYLTFVESRLGFRAPPFC